MTVLAQTGILSWAPQPGKIGEGVDGVVIGTVPSLTWYRHPATDIDYGEQIAQDIFPLEVGGSMTPRGAYRNYVFMQGGATIHPRLEENMGWLLHAVMGTGVSAVHPTEAGVNRHTFKFNTNECLIPWIAVRKHIPSDCSGTGEDMGVIGYDNKLASLRLTLPQTGLVEARCDFMGRHPVFPEDSGAWTYSDEFESFESVPVACKGMFSIPGIAAGEQPATGVIVEMTNALTTPQEEVIIGSYYMDDIIPRTRQMVVRWTFKWNSPALYRQILTGASTGEVNWTPEVFTTEKSGADYAFHVVVESPGNIPTKNVPYRLEIRANKCVWQPDGPVRLVGGGIITQQYVGTVLTPASSSDVYAEFLLDNEEASYIWPTP